MRGMNVLRILVGAVLGFIIGVGIGLAITAAYVSSMPPNNDPRNPGGRAVAPLLGVVAVPGCALASMVTGVRFARKLNRRLAPDPGREAGG